MTGKTLLPEVVDQIIETDRRLESDEKRANEALVQYRWRWTLDESNSDRMTFDAYAFMVGRNPSTIRRQANGYENMLAERQAGTRREDQKPLYEHIERARVSAEHEAVIDAVGTARGLSFQQTRKTRPDEVKRVRQMARERAEKHGTTVEEEAPKVADQIAKLEQAEKARTEERKQKIGLRFVEMEGHLAYAKRRLTDALNLAHQVPWGDEERELLSHTVDNIKALLTLIDTALTGVADVDWDAEMEKLAEVD